MKSSKHQINASQLNTAHDAELWLCLQYGNTYPNTAIVQEPSRPDVVYNRIAHLAEKLTSFDFNVNMHAYFS